MDVKSGATVGFLTALGATGGVVLSYVITEFVGFKKPLDLAIVLGLTGGLLGSFIGGSLIGGPVVTSGVAITPPQVPAGAGKILEAVFEETPRRRLRA